MADREPGVPEADPRPLSLDEFLARAEKSGQELFGRGESLEREIESLQKSRDDLLKNKMVMQEKIKAQAKELAAKDAAISGAREGCAASVVNLQDENSSLREQVDRLVSEVNEIARLRGKETFQLGEQIENQRKQIMALEREAGRTPDGTHVRLDIHRGLESEIKQLRKAEGELTEEVERIKSVGDEYARNAAQYAKEVDAAHSQLNLWRDRAMNLERERDQDLRKKVFEAEVDRLKQEVRQRDESINVLREMLKAAVDAKESILDLHKKVRTLIA